MCPTRLLQERYCSTSLQDSLVLEMYCAVSFMTMPWHTVSLRVSVLGGKVKLYLFTRLCWETKHDKNMWCRRQKDDDCAGLSPDTHTT